MVAVDREIWSGDAEAVNARTLEGELGILANHSPLLGVLAEGHVVRIVQEGGDELRFAAHGGFIQVSNNEVQVLVESAESADEIDVERARRAYESSKDAAEDDREGQAANLRAQARLRAAGESL
jgi:F-type H+-transporting ATPase subunit epsilon